MIRYPDISIDVRRYIRMNPYLVIWTTFTSSCSCLRQLWIEVDSFKRQIQIYSFCSLIQINFNSFYRVDLRNRNFWYNTEIENGWTFDIFDDLIKISYISQSTPSSLGSSCFVYVSAANYLFRFKFLLLLRMRRLKSSFKSSTAKTA